MFLHRLAHSFNGYVFRVTLTVTVLLVNAFYCIVLKKTYSVTIVTSVPWDTERVLRLVKTHMGKCLFSPELKSYLITQWNCTTIGSCRCRKPNQWVGSGAARAYGDDTRQYSRQNGWGIWLYKRSFCHRILRFTSTEATTTSSTLIQRSLLAVDMPRSRTQRPRSARLIRLQRAPASQQFRSRSLPLSGDHIT